MSAVNGSMLMFSTFQHLWHCFIKLQMSQPSNLEEDDFARPIKKDKILTLLYQSANYSQAIYKKMMMVCSHQHWSGKNKMLEEDEDSDDDVKIPLSGMFWLAVNYPLKCWCFNEGSLKKPWGHSVIWTKLGVAIYYLIPWLINW